MKTNSRSDLFYEKNLRSYEEYLSLYGGIPLSRYCKSHQINYRDMKRWMNEKRISIVAVRKSYNKAGLFTTSSSIPTAPSCLVPLCMTAADKNEISPKTAPPDILSKVKITYPTGIIVEMEEIPYSSFKALLSLTN